MKYIYTYLCCLISVLVIGQERWSEPVYDSSQATIQYQPKKMPGRKHAIVTYTRISTSHNMNPGSNVLKKVQTSVVTLSLSASTYTYVVSTPTVSHYTKNPDSGVIDIYSENGQLRTETISNDPSQNTNRLMTYTVFPVTSFTLAPTTNTIDITYRTGTKMAQFSLAGRTFTAPVTYSLTTRNAIRYQIPDFIYATSSAANDTVAIQSIIGSDTMSTTARAGTTIIRNVPASFTMAAKVYTLSIQRTKVNPGTGKKHLYERHLFEIIDHPGVLYISAGIMPLLSNRQVLVNAPSFSNNDIINHSKYNESAIYGMGYNLKIGGRIKRRHIIFADVTYMNHGFKTTYDNIDPFTGNKDVLAKARSYDLNSLLFGLGYSYNNYIVKRILNYTAEISIYSSTDDNDLPTSVPSNNLRIGLKAATGISIKPNYRHDIKVMPTLLYDFTAFTKDAISTRFYSFGLMVSYGVSLFNYKK